MHSLTTRLSAVGTQLGTCVLVLIVLNAVLSPLVFPLSGGQASVALDSVPRLLRFRDQYGEDCDGALLNLTVAADLTPLWNWNTHRIFFYVYAEYAASQTAQPAFVNRVVVWDRILATRAESRFAATNVTVEYPLTDARGTLLHASVRLVPEWSIMPITGAIVKQTGTPSPARDIGGYH